MKRYCPTLGEERDEHGVNHWIEMEEDPSGEWVRFSDVSKEMQYAANARKVVADSLAGATIDDRLTSAEVCFDLKRVASDPACPPSARRTAQDAIDVLFRNGALMLTEMKRANDLQAALSAQGAKHD